MSTETIDIGLNNVPVCSSAISATTVDENGKPFLMYRGYGIYDLVKGSFEEAVYLLMNGELPNKGQLNDFEKDYRANRNLDDRVIEHIKTYPKDVNRMDFLLTTLSYARMFDKDYNNPLWKDAKATPEALAEFEKKVGIRMGVKIPTIIAYGHRILNGKAPIPPDRNLAHSANLLHMMGLDSEQVSAKAMDVTEILYLDHTLNNSTFLARVAESARPDPYGALIAAGVGLKGVLHGGANEMARAMFDEIESPNQTEEYVLNKMNHGGIVFGFGHRLGAYKTGVESRVQIASEIARELTRQKGLTDFMEIYDRLTAIMKSDKLVLRKRRAPNLDLPVAVIYRALDIPAEWNTPIFQASRHFGWLAHMIEQRLQKGPLYRPTQKSLDGEIKDLKKYKPLSDR